MIQDFDDLTDPALVQAVETDESSTECELELANRLQCAYEEIEILVKTITDLEEKYGVDA
jgi:hypothetical protein